jgi:hypothetical protein
VNRLALALIAVALTLAAVPASAYVTYTATIDQLEVWLSGNVAFTLTGVTTGYCNNSFIVNSSDPGAKNLTAALFAAKAQGKPIRVTSYVDSYGCVAAVNNGGSYISPAYVYVLD